MTTVNIEFWQMALAKSELRVANVLKRGQSKAMGNLNRARAAYHRAIRGTEKLEQFEPDLTTTICGIPCGVVVTYYSAPRPWRQHVFAGAGPGDCTPPEPEDVDFFLVDRKGYAAKWLERKIDYQSLRDHVLQCIETGKGIRIPF